MATVLWSQAVSGFVSSGTERLIEAGEAARTALSLDESSATAHMAMAIVLLSSGDHDGAMQEAERSVELLPGHSDILNMAAIPMVYSGAEDRALQWAEESLRLNPRAANTRRHLPQRTGSCVCSRTGWRRAPSRSPAWSVSTGSTRPRSATRRRGRRPPLFGGLCRPAPPVPAQRRRRPPGGGAVQGRSGMTVHATRAAPQ